MITKFYPTEEFLNKTKTISGYPGYRVDALGSVYSCLCVGRPGKVRFDQKWRKRRPAKNPAGYHCVILINDLGMKMHLVHRLVLMAFVGVCPDGCWGLHNDGNPDNNALSNLRWDTPLANQLDRFKHGTDSSGIKNGRAKLDETQVREVRLLGKHGVKHKEIAKRFGVSRGAIGFILQRKTWVRTV